ncbi:VOC family protein [Pseudochryseolinea flava]|uniref:Glyoxalase/bleomycin resistance/extradiol dioxygenase family protein n=1 Tax=Pseudochryseolinea flava TaxID=2059302 RepID=A0A364XVV1_9BACT|nr:VOC family protein [Pseudochryseolinea flava]RAV98438.1 glyoxalase/bleomycin resistance/extradiol dioxygenase family protein [Pseudochryseolinea flava]
MKLNLVVLKTLTPDALADFYTQLGLTFEQHRHGTGPLHYAATLDDVVFEIYPLPKDKERTDDTLRLGFNVNNLDDLIQRLRANGNKIVKAPALTEWGYVAVVEDSDGRKMSKKLDARVSPAVIGCIDDFGG